MRNKIDAFLRAMRAFAADDSGQTSLEYIVIGAVVAVVLVAGLVLLGPKISGLFSHTGNCLTNANNAQGNGTVNGC